MSKIMIIDDDVASREAMMTRLVRAGFDVLSADDPDAVMKLVIREQPDAILLDMEMPSFSGLDFHASLGLTGPERDIPVIYLNGQGTPSSRENAARQGGRAFIKERYDPNELIATVTDVLASSPRPYAHPS